MVHVWKVNLYQSHIHPLTGREDKMIKRIKAAVHPSTDTESAFWVNVEGITFYHAGDHVQWSADLKGNLTKETMYLTEKASKVDMHLYQWEKKKPCNGRSI